MFSEKLIETAVNWWSERVTGKCTHDNGDRSNTSTFAGLFADLMIEPTNDQSIIDTYKKSLTNHILKASGKSNNLCLSCDYSPDFILSMAAKEAGISLHNYPWKTTMLITDKEIKVSEGYGQPYQTIYSER